MSTSIIAGGDAPLVFENAEYVFGFVTLAERSKIMAPTRRFITGLSGGAG